MAAARNLSIDVARGLSIFIMVPANMSAYVYAEPHPLWFRIASSFAAPTFILLAGIMVGIGSHAKKHDLRYFLVRAGLLAATAALVDILIWNLIPFYSYDVLYLIAISYPVTYLYSKLQRPAQWLAIGLIFLGTPLLQNVFGYSQHLSGISLVGNPARSLSLVAENPGAILQHLFIDGWFPVFPWLGVALCGASIVQSLNFPQDNASHSRLGSAGGGLLVLGVVAWWLYPGSCYERGGYSEMFYPATPGFILTGIAFAMLTLWATSYHPESPWYAPLRWLGTSALFIYILHNAVIHFWLEKVYPDRPLGEFLAVNFATLAFLVVVAWGLGQLARAWPNRPFFVRFLFGG